MNNTEFGEGNLIAFEELFDEPGLDRKIDIRTLAKVMGCSVTYIEKHYDSAIVEDMTDYITRGINEKSKDAFNDIILR